MSVNFEGGKSGLALFLLLQILSGHVGMPLILLTITVSRQVQRHAVFVNFCITWMIYSLSYVLLLYAGQIENPNPPFALCVTQAAMTYGSAPMTSISSFIFVLHIYLTLRSAVHQQPPLKWQKLRLVTMLAAPYVVYFAIFVAVMICGNEDPQRIYRSSFYCAIHLRAISRLAPGISIVAVIASVVVEVLIAIALSHHWHAFRELGSNTGLSLTLLVRALTFTICAILALVTCVALLANSTSPVPDFVIACLPMAAFLLFGTQADLLRAWCVRRKDGMTAQDFGDQASTSPSLKA